MGRKKGVAELDEVAMLEMREHLVREKWINIEKAKILRDKLRWCYRVQGVNHHRHLDSTWGKDHRPHQFHGPKVEPAEAD